MAGVIEATDRRSEFDGAIARDRARRPRSPWVAGATMLLALALIAGAGWVGANVVYYQPLTRGSWWPPPTEGAVYVRLLGDQVEVIPAVANAEFRVGTSLTNDGSRPVTIEGVARLPAEAYIEHLEAIAAPPGSFDVADLRAFEPFELGPGESAWVGHRYRFRDCPFPWYDPRPLHERLEEDGFLLDGGQGWPELTVEFSVHGWPREAAVAFMSAPWLDGVGGECPG